VRQKVSASDIFCSYLNNRFGCRNLHIRIWCSLILRSGQICKSRYPTFSLSLFAARVRENFCYGKRHLTKRRAVLTERTNRTKTFFFEFFGYCLYVRGFSDIRRFSSYCFVLLHADEIFHFEMTKTFTKFLQYFKTPFLKCFREIFMFIIRRLKTF